MTSRALFYKLMWEEIKSKAWLAALSMLILFCAVPLNVALSIGVQGEYKYSVKQAYNVWQLSKGGVLIRALSTDASLPIIVIMLGIICGLTMFAYLFSKKKTDMIHSLPVKRNMLFAVKYVTGLAIFVGTLLVNVIIMLIIAGGSHIIITAVLTDVLKIVLLHLLGFLITYTLTLFCAVLCGNLVTAGLLLGVVIPLASVVNVIITSYAGRYYSTFVSNWGLGRNLLEYFMPVQRYFMIFADAAVSNYHLTGIDGTSVLILLITFVLLFAALLVLFKIRPSEAAGKALAFNGARTVVRIIVVIPYALLSGELFADMSYGNDEGWLIFGVIFGFFVTWCITNIIIYFDFKRAFAHPVQMAVCVAVVAMIYSTFAFDVTGYDSYIPERDKVASMGVNISYMTSTDDYYLVSEDELNSGDSIFSYNNYNDRVERMNLDPELAYEFAEWLVDHVDYSKEATAELYSTDSSAEIYSTVDSEYDYYVSRKSDTASCIIKYELNSGRCVYRQYIMPVNDATVEFISNIYDNADYKESTYMILSIDDEYVSGISIENADTLSHELTLSPAEIKEFVNIYRSEFAAMTAEELKQQTPIGNVTFQFRYVSSEGSTNTIKEEYYIYPQFTNTISFAEKHGVAMHVEAGDVKNIVLRKSTAYYDDKNVYDYGAVITYSDEESIEKLLMAAVPVEYYWGYILEPDVENIWTMTVTYKLDDYGNEMTVQCYLLKDMVSELLN